MKKLPQFHPEDDPDGFRRLREAYEAALQSLQTEPPPEDNTPTGLVVRQFAEIYADFSARIDPQAWQQILDQEICQRIDTQQEIGEKLLIFCMDNYHIPHPVWKLLNSFFCWQEQQELLNEKFPANFISFVFNQNNYVDIIRYDLFPLPQVGDYDQFIVDYFAVRDAINAGDWEQSEKLLLETDLSGIEHPDYSLLKLHYYLLTEQNEKAALIVGSLTEQYPEDTRVFYGEAQFRLQNKEPEAALLLFTKVLERCPDDYNARVGVANCYYQQEDYAAAKKKFWDIVFEYPYDVYAVNTFYDVNEKLIPIYENKLAENNDDQKIIYKLASCYCICHRFSDAQSLLANVTPEEANAARHHDMYAHSLVAAGETEEALKHFYLWESSEENRLRLVRQLPAGLLELGQEEEALSKCELYLQEYPQEANLYDIKASILHSRNQPEAALAVIEQGLAVNSGHLHLYAQKAEILYEQGDNGGALESAAAALQIYPYFYNMLLLQMIVFYRISNYEEILNICARIDQCNIEEKQTEYYRTLANIGLGREIDKSIASLETYLETEPADPQAVYTVMEHYENKGDWEKVLTHLSRAIESDPNRTQFRLDRARFYRQQGRFEEAFADLAWVEENQTEKDPTFYNDKGLLYEATDDIEAARACYEKAIAVNEYDQQAYGNLAGIFAKSGEQEKAVEYYTKQLAVREHPVYYISRGLAYGALGQSELEKADYLKTIELKPDFAYAYNNMGVVLYDEDNFEEAVDYLAQALEHDPGLLSSHQNMAKSLAALGQLEKALDCLNNAMDYYKAADNRSALQSLYQQKIDLFKEHGRYQGPGKVKNYQEAA